MMQSATPADSRTRNVDARPQPVSKPGRSSCTAAARVAERDGGSIRHGESGVWRCCALDRDQHDQRKAIAPTGRHHGAPAETAQSGEVSGNECALGSLVLLAAGVAVPVSVPQRRSAAP